MECLRGCSFSFMWPEMLACPKDWHRFVLSVPGGWTMTEWQTNRSLVLASLAARHRVWVGAVGQVGKLLHLVEPLVFVSWYRCFGLGFQSFGHRPKSAFSCKTAFLLLILSSLEGLPTPRSRRSYRDICVCAVPQTALWVRGPRAEEWYCYWKLKLENHSCETDLFPPWCSWEFLFFCCCCSRQSVNGTKK